jgi:hypothetical protein
MSEWLSNQHAPIETIKAGGAGYRYSYDNKYDAGGKKTGETENSPGISFVQD